MTRRRTFFALFWMVVVASLLLTPQASAAQENGVLKVTANRNELEVHVQRGSKPILVVELQPNDAAIGKRQQVVGAIAPGKGTKKITVQRFDGKRDRIYSGFAAVATNQLVGNVRFTEEWKNVSQWTKPYPEAKSKKGLQVQMVDDALALGVQHAALNLNFGNLISLRPSADDLPWHMDGQIFHFRKGAVEGFDQRVKTLSDAGMVVTLILLFYKDADPELNRIMLHPRFDPGAPHGLTAFNTSTPEGLAWYKACLEFIAHRYSQPDEKFGRAVNFIVGNEVNSHWDWANMGRVSMEEFARDYQRTVRITHTAVRKFSSTARVFISLEHHWNVRAPGGDEMQRFAGKPFLHYFATLAKQAGDFDWHIAYHPYPENLFEPRSWLDKSAWLTFDTPKITFKNIELLPEYLKQPELRYKRQPRRIILSEQGFHSKESEQGELWQAAAYCYGYYKVDRIEGIDSFILHRHVDHGHEGGLNLGLWRRNKKGASPAEPLSKKPIYEVFHKADTAEWNKAFDFALPVIGISSWKEIDPIKSSRMNQRDTSR